MGGFMDDENFKNNEIWLALNFENPQIFLIRDLKKNIFYTWFKENTFTIEAPCKPSVSKLSK